MRSRGAWPSRWPSSIWPARRPISVARTCTELSRGSMLAAIGQIGKAHDRKILRHADASAHAFEHRPRRQHVVAAEDGTRRGRGQQMCQGLPGFGRRRRHGELHAGDLSCAGFERRFAKALQARHRPLVGAADVAQRRMALAQQITRGGKARRHGSRNPPACEWGGRSGPRFPPPGSPARRTLLRTPRAWCTPVSTRPSTRRPRKACTSAASSSCR